tara:strand:- start:42 stop:305 length:264 start_codon:yes stop_codon:yes gene_type:complete
MVIGKIGISWVKAGTLDPEDTEDYEHLVSVNEVPPKFGRNWWYTKPKLYTNLLGRDNIIAKFKLSWLCYTFQVDWWKGSKWLEKPIW